VGRVLAIVQTGQSSEEERSVKKGDIGSEDNLMEYDAG